MSECVGPASKHKGEDLAIQTEWHLRQIEFTMPAILSSNDDMSMRGLLRDARSDVQEVLEERMEGKVREGRKVGKVYELCLIKFLNNKGLENFVNSQF